MGEISSCPASMPALDIVHLLNFSHCTSCMILKYIIAFQERLRELSKAPQLLVAPWITESIPLTSWLWVFWVVAVLDSTGGGLFHTPYPEPGAPAPIRAYVAGLRHVSRDKGNKESKNRKWERRQDAHPRMAEAGGTKLLLQFLIPPLFFLFDFYGGSVVNNPPTNSGDMSLIPGSGRSLEEELTTHQYSCLKNRMDRGAWWATFHGVTKSQMLLRAHIIDS